MAVIGFLVGSAVHVVKLVFEVVCTPTSFLFKLLFRHGHKHISQVAYNLAASRAAEALKEDALFVDPLAKHFAQGAAEGANQRRPSCEDRPTLYHTESGRRSVSYTITRTKYFDDAILLAVGHQDYSVSAMFEDVRERVGMTESTCQQVVILGSGFDSRPWRLSLGATRWFEVDLKEVILEKQRLLHSAKASTSIEKNEGSRYPLQCLSIAMVPANVRRPNWIKQVKAAGLKGSVPTVWVMEGLLVYIEPHHVERILEQLSDVSPIGSFLMASVISENQLRTQKTGPVKDKWKWGCPQDAEEYFARYGWTIVTRLSWTIAAKMYGCKPRKRSFAKEQAQFIIAIKG